jgi:hypothetical protein
MKQPAYFHITANGADARHFITCKAEYFAAFNLIGVCAANCPGVIVVSFSMEDSHPHILVWGTRENCALFKERFGDQDAVTKRLLLHSRSLTIPDDWMVCNGFILPSNYIDVSRFERIYGTHNRFRVFLSSPRKREEEMLRRMSEQRGVNLEDMEARKLCGDLSKQLFGTRDPRRLDAPQRISLAQELRRQYRMTFRQLATVVRLPETEIQAYVRH